MSSIKLMFCKHFSKLQGTTEYFDKIQNKRYSDCFVLFKMFTVFGVTIVLYLNSCVFYFFKLYVQYFHQYNMFRDNQGWVVAK
jgi:hypothetical protein